MELSDLPRDLADMLQGGNNSGLGERCIKEESMKGIFMAVAVAAVIAFWSQKARSDAPVDFTSAVSSHEVTVHTYW